MSLVIHQSQVADRALAITPSTYISGALFSNILARHCTTATTAADVVVPKYPISGLHGNEKMEDGMLCHPFLVSGSAVGDPCMGVLMPRREFSPSVPTVQSWRIGRSADPESDRRTLDPQPLPCQKARKRRKRKLPTFQ